MGEAGVAEGVGVPGGNRRLPLGVHLFTLVICGAGSHPPVYGLIGQRNMHVYLGGSVVKGLPRGTSGKESACNTGNLGSVPGLGRFPEEGNGNPFQYSCLGNPMDRGAWWTIVCGIARDGHNRACLYSSEELACQCRRHRFDP